MPYLTPDEAAAYLGVSPSWLRKRAQAREINHYKIAGKLRFVESDLDWFAKQNCRVLASARGDVRDR